MHKLNKYIFFSIIHALFVKLKKKEKFLQVKACLIIASFDRLRFSESYFYDNVVKGNDLKKCFQEMRYNI